VKIERTMGYVSLSLLTSLTLLVAYSALFSGAHAASLLNSGDSAAQPPNDLQLKRKAPGTWLKKLPVLRFSPSGSSFSFNPTGGNSFNPTNVYRSYLVPSDVEFMDDSAGNMEKRFDDYGHMR
jgi:hypothetical protein